MAGKRMTEAAVREYHYTVSCGRSSVVCRCGWAVSRKQLCMTAGEDLAALTALHTKHVDKAVREAGK